MKVYIQIGTNNGNDNFNKIVKADCPDLVVLVEPNSHLIPSILQNYQDVDNIQLLNNCLHYEDDKTVSLYIPALKKELGTLAENGNLYSDAHFSLVPMNDWGDKENMIELKSISISFDTLCKRFNITEIDYLQIDTEGFDSEIIKMIDLEKYKIRKIRYERWEFDPSCFKRHNEHHEMFGSNGMKTIEDKLISHGYKLTPVNDEDGNDYIATLE
jgi:FkbM family methyltransferase